MFKRSSLIVSGIALLLALAILSSNAGAKPSATPQPALPTKEVNTPAPTGVPVVKTARPTNAPTLLPTLVSTNIPTVAPTTVPTVAPTHPHPTSTNAPQPTQIVPTNTQGALTNPYPDAPLCPDSGANHDNSVFHALWDSSRGCHYDHEHGQDPFTPEIAQIFAPLGDLRTLLGGVEIGHTNPSSPMENTHKHGGFKWQVDTSAPNGCDVGFENGTIAIDAYTIQYHAFGKQSIEFESRNHSTAGMLRQCKASNPSDKGYIYFVQLQEYGQRVMPYQGMVLPYNPEDGCTSENGCAPNFVPLFDSPRGQYFTTECFGQSFTVTDSFGHTHNVGCRNPGDTNSNNLTVWTSKITGQGARAPGSAIFTLLFRGRDNYERADSSDLIYPFTWRFVCGGISYNPSNCRFNNSTTTIHEVMGVIPAWWDGLAGYDTDPRPGRVTLDGFVDRFGTLQTNCTEVSGTCHPIKLVSAFVGKYSTDLCFPDKCSNPNTRNTPERDVYFCNGAPCLEYTPNGTNNPPINPNAIPSGWISSQN